MDSEESEHQLPQIVSDAVTLCVLLQCTALHAASDRTDL
jgi:hypothetical protein